MNKNRIYNYTVIGAGASGLFFAANASKDSFGDSALSHGLILETTSRPGTKLLMSGGGRCNITHAGSIKDFISHYESGKSIRRILYKHSNLELIKWLSENGIDTSEEDGRIFPSSRKASDVLDMLLEKSRANGFEIKTDSPVKGIKQDGDLWRVHCTSSRNIDSEQIYLGKHIIIATGGCSYPTTGSDGSMFNILARDLNLNITALSPALTPIYVKDYPYSDLSGVSVDAGVTISEGKNRKEKSIGAILFTHNNLSGPAIINISGSLSPGDRIKINYLYPLSYDTVLKSLQDSLVGNKSQLSTILAETFGLPKSFSRVLAERSGGSIKALAHMLTEDEFTVSHTGGFDVAMVTRGGISLDEVDLSTMQLVNSPGIFAIGEALDVDGETGGYNLQFAYSSALCALDGISKLLI